MIVTSMGIETRYHGPTNSRGSRVSARRSQGPIDGINRAELYVGWDYELSDAENHHKAAKELAGVLDWSVGAYGIATERGYMWGLG